MEKFGLNTQNCCILVVDTNPDEFYVAISEYGYKLVTITNSSELIEKINNEKVKFDLILLDLMVPDVNGWEVLKFIRQNPLSKFIPIIITSLRNDEIDIISGLKIGADDFIVKPINIPVLLAKIEALIRRSSWSKVKVDTPFESMKTNILTCREIEIIKLISLGRSNKKIADTLFLSELTVKTHLKNIFKKLNVSNRTEAALFAINNGYIHKEADDMTSVDV